MNATQQAEDDVATVPDIRTALSLAEAAEAQPILIELIQMLIVNRRFFGKMSLAGVLCGIAIAFLMKPVYTATATIMPPQAAQSSLSSLMGQLGSLSALSGGASSLLKNPADMYVGILQSRTISDTAIEQFHLKERWHEKTMVAARKAVASHAQFESSKDSLIQISVKEHDPKLASDLANFFVDALYRMNSTLAISEASQRRLFFEKQLDEERGALAKAEDTLKATQQKTGLITVTGQTELAIRNIAQTRAEISARQVELQSLRTYASEDNPDVARVQGEIRTLQGQLSRLEDSESHLAPGDTEIATSQIPAGGLEYTRELREVRYHDTLFDLLSRQYEAARIDEAKSAPIIQVVDRAVPPDQKSGPPRTLIILGCTVLAFLVGFAWLFLRGHVAMLRAAIR
ncbi:GumC family protein [Granulicella tundricola]|uniref:Lipopolysaccharide biosynthesis protein n=1 Tax=Granulicella tundricola (strain ATCC BAA-1859 / DSM 23138 / MP5ACTX9) TaxID=1198114 RepID=E8X6J5_GRATM|nr:Wzz/FepE/Etk N-terminal domain-containing protein [Granulicella tundricola]ADW71145.1 lipopolysaccharide biosynthesis protein [Granulicella tundricola MP5ACTX9]